MFQRAESAALVAVRSKTKQMKNRTVGIIGGGASGLMAAISAARAGAQVTLIEHMDRVGKKILSTGTEDASDELQDGAGMLPLQPEGFSHEGNSRLWRGGNAGVFSSIWESCQKTGTDMCILIPIRQRLFLMFFGGRRSGLGSGCFFPVRYLS